MEEIRFDIQKVGEQMRHAMQSTSHKQTYGETTQGAGLWWVKDQGTYLMSNGTDSNRPEVVYADGLGDGSVDQWSHVQDICGGDDFAEFIDMTDIPNPLFALTGDYVGWLVICFDDTLMEISLDIKQATAPKSAPKKKKVA